MDIYTSTLVLADKITTSWKVEFANGQKDWSNFIVRRGVCLTATWTRLFPDQSRRISLLTILSMRNLFQSYLNWLLSRDLAFFVRHIPSVRIYGQCRNKVNRINNINALYDILYIYWDYGHESFKYYCWRYCKHLWIIIDVWM